MLGIGVALDRSVLQCYARELMPVAGRPYHDQWGCSRWPESLQSPLGRKGMTRRERIVPISDTAIQNTMALGNNLCSACSFHDSYRKNLGLCCFRRTLRDPLLASRPAMHEAQVSALPGIDTLRCRVIYCCLDAVIQHDCQDIGD